MIVTIVNAAQWQPSQDEFLTAVRKLHAGDSVRTSIEAAQRQPTAPALRGDINVVKSRLLARHLLLEHLCHPAKSGSSGKTLEKSQVLLTSTVSGKPLTSFYSQRAFSVSHVPDWVCCASSVCGAIGVDITAIQSDGSTLLRAILSQEEKQHLRHKAARQQSLCFAVYWALKEAILKALGLGLSPHLQMNEITLRFDSGEEIPHLQWLNPCIVTSTRAQPVKVLLKCGKSESWVFACVQVEDDPLHVFAVVKQGESSPMSVEWHFELFDRILQR